MEIVKAIILGVVQGLSEFLPISSSGHLVLVEEILKFKEGGLAFDVFVHFGTLLSVVWVFRYDLFKMIQAIPAMLTLSSDKNNQTNPLRDYAKMNWFIVIGSVPAAIIGVLFENEIEGFFSSHVLVLFMLFVTGLIMWSSRYTKEKRDDMTSGHSILIGVAQAFAIIPGISRSGSTIVTGLWLGIQRDLAARFSFLLSVPVILGATIIKLKELMGNPPSNSQIEVMALATLAAAISGYFAIVWLLNVIRRQKLEWFGVYCISVSIIGLVWVFLI